MADGEEDLKILRVFEQHLPLRCRVAADLLRRLVAFYRLRDRPPYSFLIASTRSKACRSRRALHDDGLHLFAESSFAISLSVSGAVDSSREAKSVYPLHPVIKNTKWGELRFAMEALDRPPLWRCKDVNGHYSGDDREWFHHFQTGRYASNFGVGHHRSESRSPRQRSRLAPKGDSPPRGRDRKWIPSLRLRPEGPNLRIPLT
ncbi:hypothetical protein JOH52_002442 [Sinorhizobium meliloti]|uniref:DUF6678 family protein n=2 Tax=Rhizobium meliloti TaxID=382 RepID=UPI000A84F055|nr:DUF6678 family protein [Sinorhizobium meliloti]MBP2466421.1 hypothetical protein [Sinorhizobium meliloti]